MKNIRFDILQSEKLIGCKVHYWYFGNLNTDIRYKSLWTQNYSLHPLKIPFAPPQNPFSAWPAFFVDDDIIFFYFFKNKEIRFKHFYDHLLHSFVSKWIFFFFKGNKETIQMVWLGFMEICVVLDNKHILGQNTNFILNFGGKIEKWSIKDLVLKLLANYVNFI